MQRHKQKSDRFSHYRINGFRLGSKPLMIVPFGIGEGTIRRLVQWLPGVLTSSFSGEELRIRGRPKLDLLIQRMVAIGQKKMLTCYYKSRPTFTPLFSLCKLFIYTNFHFFFHFHPPKKGSLCKQSFTFFKRD